MSSVEQEARDDLPVIQARLAALSEAVGDAPLARALRFAADHVATAMRRAQTLAQEQREVADAHA